MSATVQVAASKDPTRNWMMSWPWLTTCHITTRLWRLWRLRLDSPSPASTHVKLIFYITRSPPGEGMNTSSSPDGDCHVLKDNRPSPSLPCKATFYEQNLSDSICAAGALCPKALLVDRTEDGELTSCDSAEFGVWRLKDVDPDRCFCWPSKITSHFYILC